MICISCNQNIRFLEDIYGLPTNDGKVLCKRCNDTYWIMREK